MSVAYYNELDPFAAEWLRNLISAGLIAPGVVDERSIVDVQPDDLAGYTQVHLFAGLGGWSAALRLAGWPDEKPIWTGSAPCQPFSDAGEQRGTEDTRHLWPEMRRLLSVGRPPKVLGEQVESKLGREWLSGVRADLEALGYAVGAADLCAAGAKAPSIRQRLFWVGDAECERWQGSISQQHEGRNESAGAGRTGDWQRVVFASECDEDGNCPVCGIDYSECRCPGPTHDGYEYDERLDGLYARWVGDGEHEGLEGHSGNGDGREEPGRVDPLSSGPVATAGRDSFWSWFSLVPCRDKTVRRVEPGTFPMVNGIPRSLGHVSARLQRLGFDKDRIAKARTSRNGRLKGYGNAIVPQIAAEFIRATL